MYADVETSRSNGLVFRIPDGSSDGAEHLWNRDHAEHWRADGNSVTDGYLQRSADELASAQLEWNVHQRNEWHHQLEYNHSGHEPGRDDAECDVAEFNVAEFNDEPELQLSGSDHESGIDNDQSKLNVSGKYNQEPELDDNGARIDDAAGQHHTAAEQHNAANRNQQSSVAVTFL